MFMKIGNEEKSKCVRPTEILDINMGINIIAFESNCATQSITLKAETDINILCKSQDYKEYLEMIKLSRKAMNGVI